MKTYYSPGRERRVCEIQEWLYNSCPHSSPSIHLPALPRWFLPPTFSFIHFSTLVPSPVHSTGLSQRARDRFTILWRCEVSWWCQRFSVSDKVCSLVRRCRETEEEHTCVIQIWGLPLKSIDCMHFYFWIWSENILFNFEIHHVVVQVKDLCYF